MREAQYCNIFLPIEGCTLNWHTVASDGKQAPEVVNGCEMIWHEHGSHFLMEKLLNSHGVKIKAIFLNCTSDASSGTELN